MLILGLCVCLSNPTLLLFFFFCPCVFLLALVMGGQCSLLLCWTSFLIHSQDVTMETTRHFITSGRSFSVFASVCSCVCRHETLNACDAAPPLVCSCPSKKRCKHKIASHAWSIHREPLRGEIKTYGKVLGVFW